jgi:uncharacterized protein (DUF1684 family)
MKRASMFVLLAALGGLSVHGQDPGAGPAWPDSAEAYWAEMEAEFRDPVHSPLTAEDRAHFEHLDRFAYDPRYRVMATFKPARKAKEFQMKTSTERLPLYRPYGTLAFTLDGRKFKLPIYQNVDLIKKAGYENHLFLPFTDLTNGDETYGGGRYIDLKGPITGPVAIDFNVAYNPYCAYSDRYSCPIPPLENHIDAPVRAGVKKFHD